MAASNEKADVALIADGGNNVGTVADKPLKDSLGDVGRFSYIGSVATTIGILFPEEWHSQWRLEVLKTLRKHLKLSEDTLQVMENMMTEQAESSVQEMYVKKLVDDPGLVKNEHVPQDLLSLMLESGGYDARTRVTIYRLTEACGVSTGSMEEYELALVENFIQAQAKMTEEEVEEQKKKEKMRTVKRYFAIGAATLAGGALIGITGGLAAPLVASASVALIGPGLAFLGTHAGIVALASVFGVAGAGLSGYKMNKRVGEVEEFEFERLTEGKDIQCTLCISGWLTKDRSDNFYVPWMTVANSEEIYCLKWESKYLLELGESLEYILEKVMTIAAKEALKYTVLAGLLAALTLPAAAYASLTAIDNPWGIVTNRAAEVGKELAEVLLMRHQGKRPITLIGFSMGARAIYFCLKELSTRKGSEGIIEDVYLMGAPVPYDKEIWAKFPRVVAGKIHNGYCQGDWLLQFVYRTASAQVTGIVGLEAVPWKHRIMVNDDLTDLVEGHLDYSKKMDAILKHMGLKQKERKKASARVYDLTQVRVGKRSKGAPSGPCFPMAEGAESQREEGEIPVIDAEDLNLSPTRRKMEEAAGVTPSNVSHSPSLNLGRETRASDTDAKRSVSMSAIAGGGESAVEDMGTERIEAGTEEKDDSGVESIGNQGEEAGKIDGSSLAMMDGEGKGGMRTHSESAGGQEPDRGSDKSSQDAVGGAISKPVQDPSGTCDPLTGELHSGEI